MTTSDPQPSREAAHWARLVAKLKITDVPAGATNLDVEGHQIVSPMQGFGALWQKTYRVRLPGVRHSPTEVVQIWKQNFPKFQPPGNHFYPPITGIKPGQVIFIDSHLP